MKPTEIEAVIIPVASNKIVLDFDSRAISKLLTLWSHKNYLGQADKIS